MKAYLAAILVSVVAFTQAKAQLSYSVTDLGTLGGTASQANGVAGRGGTNAAGMIVGSSTASDNSERAFLYTNGQMFDLNTLCDLSTSDFQILTFATSISDSCLIIGEGITTNGEKHAFLLKPLAVDGGTWSYNCCQWVWVQEGGGWWWETGCGCYKWHGPPGRHPACPPRPPHCWWWPLPCPPECGCTPPEGPPVGPPTLQPPTLQPPVGPPTLQPPVGPPTLQPPVGPPTLQPPVGPPTPPPPPNCWCCINGRIGYTTWADCKEKEGQCYGSKKEALKHCKQTCWSCINGQVVQVDCQAGGEVYHSKDEAFEHCTHVGPPTIKPPTVGPPTIQPPTVKPPTIQPPVLTTLQPQTPTLQPPTVKPPTIQPPVLTTLQPQPPTVRPPTVRPPTIQPPVLTTLQPQTPTLQPPTVKPPTLTHPLHTMPLKVTPPPPPPLTPPPPPTPALKIPGKSDLELPGKPTPTPTPSSRHKGTRTTKGSTSGPSSTIDAQSLRRGNKPTSTVKPHNETKKAKPSPTPGEKKSTRAPFRNTWVTRDYFPA